MAVQTKCIYDAPAPSDGLRLLVMRFWPRGIRKEKVDAWEKDLGTSPELIRAWKDEQITWAEFSRRYRAEVKNRQEKIAELAGRAKEGTVTLLCSCRDGEHCHRAILKELIEGASSGARRRRVAASRA